MFSQAEKNYCLDIVLLIIGMVCLLTGLAIAQKPSFLAAFASPSKMKFLHEWSGYLFTALIALHLALHVKWIKHMTNSIQAIKNKSLAALALAILSVFLCISIVVLAPAGRIPPKNPAAQGTNAVK